MKSRGSPSNRYQQLLALDQSDHLVEGKHAEVMSYFPTKHNIEGVSRLTKHEQVETNKSRPKILIKQQIGQGSNDASLKYAYSPNELMPIHSAHHIHPRKQSVRVYKQSVPVFKHSKECLSSIYYNRTGKESPQNDINTHVLKNPQKHQKFNPDPQLERIKVQASPVKPKFGFSSPKPEPLSPRIDSITNVSLSSWSSDRKNKQLGPSNLRGQEPDNFRDVFTIMPSKQQEVMGSDVGVTNIMIPSAHTLRQQSQMLRKIQKLKSINQGFTQQIRERQRQIAQKYAAFDQYHHEYQQYSQGIQKAYSRIQQKDDHLPISSFAWNNSQCNNQILLAIDKDMRKKKRKILQCKFVGISKQLYKQIIYGKALLIESQLVQIGYSSAGKADEVILYYQFKQNFRDVHIFINENHDDDVLLEGGSFRTKTGTVMSGKKMKLRVGLKPRDNSSKSQLTDKFSLMTLNTTVTTSSDEELLFFCLLPVCLYRTFVKEVGKDQAYQERKKYVPTMITTWQQCGQDLSENPHQFLSTLLKEGYDTKTANSSSMGRFSQLKTFDAIRTTAQCLQYFSCLIYREQIIRLTIFVAEKCYAIEMQNQENAEVIKMLGSLLAKNPESLHNDIN